MFINKTTSVPGGIYDRRPANVEGFVKGSTSGFYFDAATNIRLRYCAVYWGANKPAYFAYAVESRNVVSLKLDSVSGTAAQPGKPKFSIK